jgi:hypothetical protein
LGLVLVGPTIFSPIIHTGSFAKMPHPHAPIRRRPLEVMCQRPSLHPVSLLSHSRLHLPLEPPAPAAKDGGTTGGGISSSAVGRSNDRRRLRGWRDDRWQVNRTCTLSRLLFFLERGGVGPLFFVKARGAPPPSSSRPMVHLFFLRPTIPPLLPHQLLRPSSSSRLRCPSLHRSLRILDLHTMSSCQPI